MYQALPFIIDLANSLFLGAFSAHSAARFSCFFWLTRVCKDGEEGRHFTRSITAENLKVSLCVLRFHSAQPPTLREASESSTPFRQPPVCRFAKPRVVLLIHRDVIGSRFVILQVPLLTARVSVSAFDGNTLVGAT